MLPKLHSRLAMIRRDKHAAVERNRFRSVHRIFGRKMFRPKWFRSVHRISAGKLFRLKRFRSVHTKTHFFFALFNVPSKMVQFRSQDFLPHFVPSKVVPFC